MRTASARHQYNYIRTGLQLPLQLIVVVYGSHVMPIDAEDYVTALDAQIAGKAALLHLGHQHALLGFEVELTGNLLGLVRGEILDRQTQNAAALRSGFGFAFSPLAGAAVADDLVPVGHFHIGGGAFTLAQVFDVQFLADVGVGNNRHQFVSAVHRLAINAQDHVAPLQASVVGRTVRLDGVNDNTVVRAKAAQQGRLGLRVELHADGATLDRAIGDDGVVDLAGSVRGNGEPYSVVAPAPCGNGRVDADHLCGQVYQRSATIAGIDGGIGLQEALKLALRSPFDVAAFGADNPGGYGGIEAEGASDRQHPVTHPHGIRVTEFGRKQRLPGVDLNDGEVGPLVEADHPGLVLGDIVAVQVNRDADNRLILRTL